MHSPDKLELLKSSLKLLTAQMRDEDTIAIAVYAGAAGVVLEPTPARQRAKIIGALDRLSAGGSTNGGAGIALAYSLAEQALVEGGVNRVILATDGDFNVGTVNHAALEELVEDKRELGIALTVLGFGSGNYQDGLMQRLAQIGNGNAAYIDSLNEARKVLVDELAATLEVIAQDVKIQVEFNPAVVAEYRLIGYETRKLAREDFNNDRVDAGDIGAGHTVTALYEIALVGSGGQLMDPLRYGRHDAGSQSSDRGQRAAPSGEIAHLRLRYKRPGERDSELREFPLHQRAIIPRLADTSDDYRFSAAAAAFGQLLRGGRYTGVFSFADVADLARGARGEDHFGYRGEFLRLVDTADALSGAKVSQR
jgi:Ca-activated chloride channel family protein